MSDRLTDSQRGGVIAVRVPGALDAAIKRAAAEELISKSAFCRRAVLQMLPGPQRCRRSCRVIHDLHDEAGRVVANVLLYGDRLERLERGETIAFDWGVSEAVCPGTGIHRK